MKERKQALCCARPASSPMLRQLTLVPYSKVWLGFRSSLPPKIPSSGIKSEFLEVPHSSHMALSIQVAGS